MTFTRRKFNRKFRGGKKKTIRKKRKTRRKRRGGRFGPFGKQKPLSQDNPPKKGDKVRIDGDPGWTVTLPYPNGRAAKVCRTEEVTKSDFGYLCGGEEKEVPYTNMTKRGSLGQMGLRGGRKKQRKSRKKSKRKKRRKKKTKKRRRRRRQRGGMGQYNCVYPSNVGEIFTGIKLNKNPVLPDPINTNGNTRTVQKLKQKGGGFLDNIGLGDGLLGWYKGTNAISNVPIRYKGGKALMKADPMHQPGLYHEEPIHKTANVPKFYTQASDKAVDPKFTIKTEQTN